LGGHLRNAQNKYDDGQRQLDKFTMELTQVQREEPQ